MTTIVKHFKQLWDAVVTVAGAGFFFLMQSRSVMMDYIEMGVGLAVIIFALVRTYYWIKHKGYVSNKGEPDIKKNKLK